MRKIIIALVGVIISCSFLNAQRSFTSGEIQSTREVTFGRFEMLMYSSDVSGTTSTFFMWKQGGQNSDSRWNELDIETFGKSAGSWQSNPIWQYNDNDQNIKRWEEIHSDIPVANTWVKFTMEWTPDYIAWFNNDVEVRRIVRDEDVPAGHHRYNNGDSDDPVNYITDAMRMSFNHWATYPGEWLGAWNPADLPSFQFVDWLTYEPWNGNGFDPVDFRLDFDTYADVTNNFTVSTHTFTENQCQFSDKAVGVTNGYLWLGIFGVGNERNPQGDEIPGSSGGTDTLYTHSIPGLMEAEEFQEQSGLQTETVTASEGEGENVGYTTAGDWAEYIIDVVESGEYSIDFRVASLAGGAGLSLKVDNETIVNDLSIASTGDWQNWITLTEMVPLSAGKHTLRMDVLRDGFNINWMDFKFQSVTGVTQDDLATSVFYPNPVENELHLLSSSNWKLLNISGQVLKSGNSDIILMSDLQSGLYILEIEGESYKVNKL